MKKYQVIYADPPWRFNNKAYQDAHREMLSLDKTYYKTLSINQLKQLPVAKFADTNCALFLWTTDAHLVLALEVMKEWKFKYITIAFVWLKKYESGSYVYNFAPWTLKSHEICLLGTKGQMGKYKTANNIKGLVEAVRTIHSKKPNEIRQRITRLFGNSNLLELFAREKHAGWDVWGNEVISDINMDDYKRKEAK